MENPQKNVEKKKIRKSLHWRYWTVWAAYIDLAVLCVGLAIGVFMIVQRVTETVDGVDPCCGYELTEEEKRNATLLRFASDVTLTLLVSLSMLGIWATIRLLAATKHGNAKNALEMAMAWRNVKLAIIAFTMVALFNNSCTNIATCGAAIWHAIGFYLGCQFTHELEVVVTEENATDEAQKGTAKIKATEESKVTVPNTKEQEMDSKLIVESA